MTLSTVLGVEGQQPKDFRQHVGGIASHLVREAIQHVTRFPIVDLGSAIVTPALLVAQGKRNLSDIIHNDEDVVNEYRAFSQIVNINGRNRSLIDYYGETTVNRIRQKVEGNANTSDLYALAYWLNNVVLIQGQQPYIRDGVDSTEATQIRQQLMTLIPNALATRYNNVTLDTAAVLYREIREIGKVHTPTFMKTTKQALAGFGASALVAISGGSGLAAFTAGSMVRGGMHMRNKRSVDIPTMNGIVSGKYLPENKDDNIRRIAFLVDKFLQYCVPDYLVPSPDGKLPINSATGMPFRNQLVYSQERAVALFEALAVTLPTPVYQAWSHNLEWAAISRMYLQRERESLNQQPNVLGRILRRGKK